VWQVSTTGKYRSVYGIRAYLQNEVGVRRPAGLVLDWWVNAGTLGDPLEFESWQGAQDAANQLPSVEHYSYFIEEIEK
jgi:hypothetical protein